MPRVSPHMACTLLAAPFAHDPTQGDGRATPVLGVLVVAERGDVSPEDLAPARPPMAPRIVMTDRKLNKDRDIENTTLIPSLSSRAGPMPWRHRHDADRPGSVFDRPDG